MEITPISDFKYKIENDSIILIKYIGAGFRDVEIPSEYDINGIKYNVSKIDKNAFEQSSIISVKIGDNITLEHSCFFNCKLLKTVILPKTLEIIPIKAFGYCNNLVDINLENVKYIEASAFMYCENLKKIDLSNAIQIKGFPGCKKLKEIKNPNKVISIGTRAFAYCKELEHFYFSSTLQEINQEAFLHSGLLEITLPNVKLNGKAIFAHCENLETIHLNEKIDVIPTETFFGNHKIEVDLKNIKTIKERAFYLCEINNIILNNCNIIDGFEKSTINNIFLNGCSIMEDSFKLAFVENLEMSGKTNLLSSAFYASKINRFLIKENTIFTCSDVRFRDCKINIDSMIEDIPIKKMSGVNIRFKETYENLLTNKYNLKQINQIFKGYEINVFLSNLSQKFDEEIMREILIAYKKNAFDTQKILNNLINENESLEAEIKLHKFLSKINDDFLLYMEEEREK